MDSCANSDICDVNANVKITNSLENINTVIIHGIEIYEIVLKSQILDEANLIILMNNIKEKYKNFAYTFPIIFKWIIMTKQFNPEALKKFLNLYSNREYKTREEFIIIQIEYIIYYNQMTFPEKSIEHYNNMRINMYNNIIEEDKQFIEQYKN